MHVAPAAWNRGHSIWASGIQISKGEACRKTCNKNARVTSFSLAVYMQYIDLCNAENKCNKISLDISFTRNSVSVTYFTLFSKNHSIDY